MPDQSFSAERLIGMAFYAPIGLGVKLLEELPANMQKVQRHVALARFVGKTTIAQGTKELRRLIAPEVGLKTIDDSAPPIGDLAAPIPTPAAISQAEISQAEIKQAEADSADDSVEALHAHDLALPDYDHLPATHIVGKLAGLDQDERDQIESYERARRHRRTVLGKLAQLQDS